MPVTVTNPYSGQEEQTCSVSFAAQQKLPETDIGGAQTEGEYSKSKLLGEWGVLKAKLFKGDIPKGTKVLSYTGVDNQHGYVYVSGKNKLSAKVYAKSGNLVEVDDFNPANAEGWIKSDKLKVSIPQSVGTADKSTQLAVPSPAPPVQGDSLGSMTHEDVSAMFVKVKDDLAKEQGLNIKGANPALDEAVFKAIAAKTGYTPAEAKGKVDAYKAAGNKLSALKKKVLSGSKKVPEGQAQPTKATPAAPLNVGKATNKPAQDPKPNGVPTVATPKLADEVKKAVKQEVKADPGKVYSDEDIAAQYIISKDKIVAASNGKWTLYTKSDEMEKAIYDAVLAKTGFTQSQSKQAIASYLGSGKKLSVLKKHLIKQGAFEAKADTLKKSGAAKAQAGKVKDVEAKADAGYTPTPTPATGDPPIDIGKPAPKAVQKEAQEAGDIGNISAWSKTVISSSFQKQSFFSNHTAASKYDALVDTLSAVKEMGLGNDLTLLQIIRVVDEDKANQAGVQNSHLLEKQIVSWLSSPAGTQYIKEKENKIAKQAELARQEAEAAAAAKELEASQPPLPADSASFQVITPTRARELHNENQLRKKWSSGEEDALRTYTGGAYRDVNNALRTGSYEKTGSQKAIIDAARSAMRPSTEPILLHRGADFRSLGIPEGSQLIWTMTGKTVQDKGFTSTSAGGGAAFFGSIEYEIEAPKGTPMAWLDHISQFPGENEMLLPPGTKFKVLQVRRGTSSKGNPDAFIMRVRVVEAIGG